MSVRGIGVISTAAGAARDEAAIAAAIAAACGDVDLRGMDPSARLVIAATGRALADAGLPRLRGELRDRTGIFGGASGPPRASVDEFQRSLERGLDRGSAPAFARTVGHAPVGSASCAFGARGPATTVAGDDVAGLLAIAYAARWLADRDDADRIVAGGFDERASGALGEEGAAFVVLAAEAGGPRIAGVATAGSADEAIARALRDAAVERSEVEAWSRAGGGEAASFRTATAFVAAVRAVREGARAAVVSAEGAQGAVAIVLLPGEEKT